jgi:hypothetical protein
MGGIRSSGVGDADVFVAKLSVCITPGRVAMLKAGKVPPSETLLSWDPEPLSGGGYRVYSVSDEALIPFANVSGSQACTAPAGQTECTHNSSLPPPPDLIFYQVIGVCGDGITEGPI